MVTANDQVAAPSLEGRRLGRYRLRYRIAQGGMASVYLAQLEGTHGFERWVAVKVVHPHLTEQRRFAHMLLDEARVSAKIHHPNVCAMLDFGEQNSVLYLVMEYLHGESFSSLMRRAFKVRGRVEPWLAARVVLDAALGLQAAHELSEGGKPLGVVHRDVSPQNIQVLYQGQSKVVDFGIARARGRLTSTDAGEIKGKLSYMAPEQVRNLDVDQRADVWALGVVLWEATTGRRLFRTDSHGSTVLNVVEMEVPRPTALFPDYPPALEEVILGALERDVGERIQSAGDLAAQLEEFLYSTGRPAGARQVSMWMREHFAEKLVKRDRMLQSDDADTAGPVPEVDLQSESSVASRVRKPSDSESDGSESVPDTQAEIELPEARAGLAVPPPAEAEADDDEQAATMVADPPQMPEVAPPSRPISGLRPSPNVRDGVMSERGTDPPTARDPADFESVITSPDEPLDSLAQTMRDAPLEPVDSQIVVPTVPNAKALAEGPARAPGRTTGESPAPPPIATPFSPTAKRSSSGVPRVALIAALIVLVVLALVAGLAFVLASSEEEPEEVVVQVGGGTEEAAGTETVSEAETGSETETETGSETFSEAENPGDEPESGEGPASVAGTESDTRARRSRSNPDDGDHSEMERRPPAEPGTLNLMAIPPADIYLGRRHLGRTPLVNFELSAGRHTLEARPVGGGPSKRIRVSIRPGEQTRESVRF
jgi:serine/threonine-protein kinase